MTPSLPDHNEIIRNRYAKAEALREGGTDPYPTRWDPDTTANSIHEHKDVWTEERRPVRIAGRIMTARHMGKASFLDIKDATGRVQAYVRRDDVGDAAWALLKDSLDLGDIVGIAGEAFTTRTGEVSIHTRTLTLLSKSVRPLPEKWHGLTDKETRYRQRYVDLIVNDDVRATFVQRSRLIANLRAVLTEQGYLEVETPMMHPIAGGAAARPFVTHHNALDMPLFLRIAPELYLKRLVVGGLERTFEINRNFRNEGLSPRHNPEFTMLELYTAWWDYRDTMRLTEETLREVAIRTFGRTEFTWSARPFDLAPEFERLTYLDAITRHIPGLAAAGLSWSDTPEETSAKLTAAGFLAGAAGTPAAPQGVTPTYVQLTTLFEEHVEPHLVGPVFITEFPKAASPLAKSRPDNPDIAERFELYLCGMELANGYSELNDPAEQHAIFLEQAKAKLSGDDEAHGLDEDYIRALEHGMPPTSGLGVGIDRLALLLTDSPSIRDVILFPLMRPERVNVGGEEHINETPT